METPANRIKTEASIIFGSLRNAKNKIRLTFKHQRTYRHRLVNLTITCGKASSSTVSIQEEDANRLLAVLRIMFGESFGRDTSCKK